MKTVMYSRCLFFFVAFWAGDNFFFCFAILLFWHLSAWAPYYAPASI